MKTTAGLAAVLAAAAATTSFAAVTFVPESISVRVGTTSVSFDITVAPSATLGSGQNVGKFNGADIVLGWNEAGALSFDLAPEWIAAFSLAPGTPSIDNGIFTHDVYVGGANIAGDFFSSVRMGTVTLDTSALPAGTYQVVLDSEISMLASGADNEPVSGIGTIRIVAGDIDGDGSVNVSDLQRLVTAWARPADDPDFDSDADLNGDGFVNILDLCVLVANWAGPQP